MIKLPESLIYKCTRWKQQYAVMFSLSAFILFIIITSDLVSQVVDSFGFYVLGFSVRLILVVNVISQAGLQGTFLGFGSNVHLDSRVKWLEFIGRRSLFTQPLLNNSYAVCGNLYTNIS